MRIGSSFLLVLLFVIPISATEPLRKTRIDGLNLCEFVSKNVIAYTTDQGELTLCNATNLKTIQDTFCNRSGVSICGAVDGIVVVQANRSVMGFCSKTLKKVFKIAAPDVPLTTATSSRKKIIAVFHRSGTVGFYSLRNGRRLGRFAVGPPKYAQSWMRFEFTNEGDGLFFFLHSIWQKDDTVTRINDLRTGKVTHFRNNWHKLFGEPIEDASLLVGERSALLLVTPTKGIYHATTRGRRFRLLFVPPATAYGADSVQIGMRRLAFVHCEDSTVRVYDVDTNRLCDTIRLPRGFVRSFSVSPDHSRAAIVVRGEDGDNLVLVDLEVYKKK